MEKIKLERNFIIYVLLIVFTISGMGMGLDKDCQVFSPYHNSQNSKISDPSITVSDDLHTFQVGERSSVTFNLRNLNGNRSRVFSRVSLLFLGMLAVLSVFFKLLQEVFVFYKRLYVRERYYMISFMQDMDGRKRVS